MLIANTDIEAKQLLELYDADPARVEVVHPGVDLDVFRPVPRDGPRAGSACRRTRVVLMFAGRIQPLKAPDVLLRAVARAARARPGAARRGWSSRSSAARPAPAWSTPSRWPSWPPRSASPTWCGSCRRWRRPSSPTGTPRRRWSCVPSYNESFGLVAVEAQAAGTPGRRRRRRRADHGGARRRAPGCSSRATTRPTTRGRCERIVHAPGLRAELSRGALRAGRPLRVGAHRRPHPRGLPGAPRGRCATTWRERARDASARTPSPTRPRPRSASHDLDLDGDPPTGVFTVELPGEKKLQTPCRLDVGEHALGVHAFVCRQPRREPRAGLPLAARAQPEDVRRRASRSTRSATSTSTAGCRWSRSPPRRSTGCSARC